MRRALNAVKSKFSRNGFVASPVEEIAVEVNSSEITVEVNSSESDHLDWSMDSDSSAEHNDLTEFAEHTQEEIEKLKKDFQEYSKHSENSDGTLNLRWGGLVDLDFAMDYSTKLEKSYIERGLKFLPLAEATNLIYLAPPHSMKVKKVDAEEARNTWDLVQKLFPEKIKKISWTVDGIKDNWKENTKIIGQILPQISNKMMKEAPEFICISLSRSQFEMTIPPSDGQNSVSSCVFHFSGDWNLPWAQRELMAAVAPTIMGSVNKFYLILDVPCMNCVDHILTHLGWKFDKNTEKPVDEFLKLVDNGLNPAKDEKLSFDLASIRRSIKAKQFYNSLKTDNADTELFCFYGKTKAIDRGDRKFC